MSVICNEAIYWVLHRLDYQVFKAMLRANTHFRTAVNKGGFKIQRENFRLPRISGRLAAVISRDAGLTRFFFLEGLRQCASMKGLTKTYESISGDWLKENWNEWFHGLKDARPFAYAMLCDSSHEWAQRIGERLLACPSFWKKAPLPLRPNHPARVLTVEPAETPRDHWALEVNPAFLEKTRCASEQTSHLKETSRSRQEEEPAKPMEDQVGVVPLTKSIPHDANGKQSNAVAEGLETTMRLREENETHDGEPAKVQLAREPRQAEKKSADVLSSGDVELSSGSRLGDALRERDQLRKRLRILEEVHARELAEKESEVEELQKRMAVVQTEFQDALGMLKADTEREMQAQVADFEANVLGVHPDLVTFAQKAVREGEGLRERTTQMLQRQRETNRRYGTMQTLRDELHKTDQMLSQVKIAVEEAVQPVAGMVELQRDLESHIEELRHRLHGDVGVELKNETLVMPARLRACIVECTLDADGLAQLDAIRQMLDSPVGRLLYGQEERKEALELLERRRILALKAIDHVGRLEATTGDEAVTGKLKVIHQLVPYLEHFANVDLFVDAYNVIKQDPYWSALEETPNGFQEARKDFIRKCATKAKLFHSLTLVFDSDLPATTSEGKKNFTVVYVGMKTEGQNADNYLVEKLDELAGAEAEQSDSRIVRWLVTNDHLLRLRVCNNCEAVVACQCFAIFLKS
ncbi:MAG: NYN domain-containing protein [Victivallales bacterium]|nr:NYN domain-containing protein [Victivallales bacterium]